MKVAGCASVRHGRFQREIVLGTRDDMVEGNESKSDNGANKDGT